MTKYLLLLLATISSSTEAHTRLECPPPRSGETGVKIGPCDAPDDLSLPAYPLKPGALNTITWLESIPHPGAPARFALSREGDDSEASFESCLLLDHVPHDSYSLPTFGDELTWHRSSITLWIPDVYCERCHLQLMTVMSDEIHGVPADTTCAYAGALNQGMAMNSTLPACPVVYHSCSPVSINGTIPRDDIDQCNTTEFELELNWPMTPSLDDSLYQHSQYYYKGDPGMYNQTMSRLMAAGEPIDDCESFRFCDPQIYFQQIMQVPEDAKYAAMEGSCAAIVTMQVIPFELGVLPSEPKNMSAPPPEQPSGPCADCEIAKPCFFEACPLRDMASGAWAAPADGCNFIGGICEPCFPDSSCLMGNESAETEAPTEENTSAATEAPTEASTSGNDDDGMVASGGDRVARTVIVNLLVLGLSTIVF